jgi:glycosyltransferase involved in cell wall biosynthesis
MRITILQGAFFPVPPLLGGAVEKMWFRLGKEFAARGHEVVQVSRAHPQLAGEEMLDGVRHVRVRGYDQPANGMHLKLLDLLYTLRAVRRVPKDSDIVVTNTFWAPWLLPKRLRSRAYIDVQRMPKGQCRWYRSAARLRANSTPVLEAIRAELPESQHGRVRMIPNPLPFDPLTHLDVAGKEQRVLYAGRIHPEKGLDLLLQASRGLPANWTLHLVGPWQTGQGGGGDAYLQRLRQLAPPGRVHFHGPVHGAAELARHYQQARLFAYPSVAEKGETFGLAPLEAMAHGCVPVVSDLACFKDFIADGVNGRIFDHRTADATQALERLLHNLAEDTGTCERLARAAFQVNASHAPGRIAEEFLEDFAGLIR